MVSDRRYYEMIQAINFNDDPKELNLNDEEQKVYNSMIREKEAYKAKYGVDLHFDFPMEVYNNIGI